MPFVSACKVWQGTATQLIEETELDITPNVLSRSLNALHSVLLNDYNIEYKFERKHSGKIISLSIIE